MPSARATVKMDYSILTREPSNMDILPILLNYRYDIMMYEV